MVGWTCAKCLADGNIHINWCAVLIGGMCLICYANQQPTTLALVLVTSLVISATSNAVNIYCPNFGMHTLLHIDLVTTAKLHKFMCMTMCLCACLLRMHMYISAFTTGIH